MPSCKQYVIEKVVVTYRDPMTHERFERVVNLHRYDMLVWGQRTRDLIAPGLAAEHEKWSLQHPAEAAAVHATPIWEPLPAVVSAPPGTMALQDAPGGGEVLGPVCVHEWTCNIQCC